MSRVYETVRECIVVGANINPNIDRQLYFCELVREGDDDVNYVVFCKFACVCSSSLLVVLFASGYFADDWQMLVIAANVIRTRRCFEEDEEDIGGRIERLLRVADEQTRQESR